MAETQDERVRADWAAREPLLRDYYDTEWGLPVHDESGVFERLTLEGFQAGLSWITILRKREHFRRAFVGFDIERVAAFDEARVGQLMLDGSIVRNRMKIEAAVGNARATIQLRDQGTDLAELVWSFRPETSPVPLTDADVPSTSPESHALARELKRHGFRFVGPTTAFALMTAIGIVDVHLATSHRRGCSGIWNADGTRVLQGDSRESEIRSR